MLDFVLQRYVLYFNLPKSFKVFLFCLVYIGLKNVDFSNVDFCQYPDLVFVNLSGTPNNFEETQDNCYEKFGNGYGFNK